ncbi:MAG: hypothetical protein H6Q90_1682 [Deltaproteobacteria bacterium]|nr:hypothetical protein [Deltaproteobacteria bacterium]
MWRQSLLLVLAVAACNKAPIEVSRGDNSSDYNHAALQHAVDKFVAQGRTPKAYGELATTMLVLRPGMDRAVGEEAELRLVVFALGPVQAMSGKPMSEQIDALALTVWPTLLAPEIAADEIARKRPEKSLELYPKPGEDTRTFMLRLCDGPLAHQCQRIVPEHQGAVIAALAIRRATERTRNAVGACRMCATEPGWHESVRQWEALDLLAAGSIHDVERQADPDNWPTAGKASEADPGLPEAEINEIGQVVISGQRYSANRRVEALKDLRNDQPAIALHLRPELTLAQVKGVISDARKSGATKIAVIARSPRYPWDRRIYWVADGVGTRAGLRATDTLQLLLDAVDHVAGPGAIARVD